MQGIRRFKLISTLITTVFRYRRKAAVEDLAVKPVTQFPVEIDNEVNFYVNFFFLLSALIIPSFVCFILCGSMRASGS